MKKLFLVVFLILLQSSGCGYTTQSVLPSQFKSVYIEAFPNHIDFTAEGQRNLYVPLIEVDVRKAIINRFHVDGHLKVADSDTADLVLKGELKSYSRDALRFTTGDNPQEYRVTITVSLEMWDTANNVALWHEGSFVGEATYFIAGSQTSSEEAAIGEAVKDLARRIVERTIENW